MTRLGDAFAALAAKECKATPYEAKMALYHELDDAYGKHFDEVFNTEDRTAPFFIRDLGASIPQCVRHSPLTLRKLAREFIQGNGLERGEWKRTWKDIATGKATARAISKYKEGELGSVFLSRCDPAWSQVHRLCAKRLLVGALGCAGADRAVFSSEDRASDLFPTVMDDEGWDSLNLQDTWITGARDKAEECARNFRGDTLIGVTFGWFGQDVDEWHTYGSLISTTAFRCDFRNLPWVFGAANYETDPKLLSTMYHNSYLVVVTAAAMGAGIPDMLHNTFVYNFPMTEVRAMKWCGTLPRVLGTYTQVSREIRAGYEAMRKGM